MGQQHYEVKTQEHVYQYKENLVILDNLILHLQNHICAYPILGFPGFLSHPLAEQMFISLSEKCLTCSSSSFTISLSKPCFGWM